VPAVLQHPRGGLRQRRVRRPAPGLSVVVPAWNEAERICDCVEQLRTRLRRLRPEIVVVDDGSTDGTAAVCGAWIAAHRGSRVRLLRGPHRGKGAAVYAGAQATRGAVVAYLDADLDVPVEEVARLYRLRAAASWDVAVGSKRRLAWRHSARPPLRTALSILFGFAVRQLFGLPLRDTQTGVKMFNGRWLRAVAPHARVRGFLFDVELLAVAAAEGLRLVEVPVTVGMRRPLNRLGVGDVVRCLAELPTVAPSVRRIRGHLRAARAASALGPARR